MLLRRADQLSRRGKDLAVVMSGCSPGQNQIYDWRVVNPTNTLYVAGGMDSKYSSIGRTWTKVVSGSRYEEVASSGHALLTEAPIEVANIIGGFLLTTPVPRKVVFDPSYYNGDKEMFDDLERTQALRTQSEQEFVSPESDSLDSSSCSEDLILSESKPSILVIPSVLDMESFSIDMVSNHGKTKGVFGIGWGTTSRKRENEERRGFIIQLSSSVDNHVGVGEVAPLPGLHTETTVEAGDQLQILRDFFNSENAYDLPALDANKALALDGAITSYVDEIANESNIGAEYLLNSVRTGLEMALIALSSQVCQLPLHQAISANIPGIISSPNAVFLPINGLITADTSSVVGVDGISLKKKVSPVDQPPSLRRPYNLPGVQHMSYPSLKVKVGSKEVKKDAERLFQSFSESGSGMVRADANRMWNEKSAISFVSALDQLEHNILDHLEFIEEPLEKQKDGDGALAAQVKALEKLYCFCRIPYALDESLADLVAYHQREFSAIASALREALRNANGCTAFVLKPALLGFELSVQLARFATAEGIGAVFSSSFDSGIGLSYTAFIAAASDSLTTPTISKSKQERKLYSHGLGTFQMLSEDTLSPPFSAYVSMEGKLDISSLERELYGLSIDELRDSSSPWAGATISSPDEVIQGIAPSTFTSSSSVRGRQVNLKASLPLPFSDKKACDRFTDLPQQSRWSPWLRSVEYVAAEDGRTETEWTLDILGKPFRWRAVSTISSNPRGIIWESVSGLRNEGVAQFQKTSDDSCVLHVDVSFMTPRAITYLFRGGSKFESFLREKLLKWSLEMFRDVVKADLALERGDVELGDALFGAVEGRASAIEVTLSFANGTIAKN
mmetsp:Transcript_22037/g.32192  ORF Transcript_22037/g.32192 Transcript_22037/m.32192 type:complete len:849 (+) Transcript_22037:3-2549(+)